LLGSRHAGPHGIAEAAEAHGQRGQAPRARILRHAAELIYAKGVRATNNELLRSAAGVSGSQLTHYFPNKESLVLAVIDWQADSVLGFHRSERFAGACSSLRSLATSPRCGTRCAPPSTTC
jgi:AcrR family transcriptional regulator